MFSQRNVWPRQSGWQLPLVGRRRNLVQARRLNRDGIGEMPQATPAVMPIPKRFGPGCVSAFRGFSFWENQPESITIVSSAMNAVA